MSKKAMLIVDVQYDFCEGGSLAIAGGNRVAADIAEHLKYSKYDLLVFTQDWHIDPGTHWSENPDFVDTWPVHCAAATHGAEIHEVLQGVAESPGVYSVRKGMYDAAYSGFEAVIADDPNTSLMDLLTANDIEAIDIAGLALDYCVRATASDGSAAGFATRVFHNLSAAVSPENSAAVLSGLREGGVAIV